ncbi:MAG: glycogen synthase [Candidatus Melainabacteria bacterium GWF2_37_15]|nr:MAG: glycogen synthase [Candidatus Melainabacteria bacterium GWF2_37_15]
MRPKFKILICASEVVPFAKTGGLADVAGSLPKELKKLGHDVRVVMPRYWEIDKEKYGLKPVPDPLGVPMGVIGEMWCGVLEGKIPGTDVPVYFIEHEHYYGRKNLYNDDSGQGFMDNDNRFVFLSRACLQLCKKIGFYPDVIHANDWQTAAIPVLLNTAYRHDPVGNAASVLTIHNMQHQGSFYEGLMDVLGIGWKHYNFLELEFNDQVNLLKGGILHSTHITTVSDGYAKEIQSHEHGWGLDGVVRDRAGNLYGILNGCDYDEWNPETDKHIIKNYSASDLSGKLECKRDLQRTFGLPVRDDIPLFGIVTRLVRQKGVDILAEALYKLMGLDAQFVLLGTGEVWSHFYFGGAPGMFPEKVGVNIGFSNELAHKIEAGSDFFLMPSRFEPCGLNQMYSLRYGTLPIVRAVGGLNDTVENFNEQTLEGNGFKFHDLTPNALFDTVGWATYTYYHNKPAMKKLIQNAMNKRFTWEDAARKYDDVYYLAVRNRRNIYI